MNNNNNTREESFLQFSKAVKFRVLLKKEREKVNSLFSSPFLFFINRRITNN